MPFDPVAAIRMEAFACAMKAKIGDLPAQDVEVMMTRAEEALDSGDPFFRAISSFATQHPLVRFDAVYHLHFKCNKKRIIDYPNLWGFTRELYQVAGVAQTVRMDHIVRHYHYSHDTINPHRIIPTNPRIDWMAPHGRG